MPARPDKPRRCLLGDRHSAYNTACNTTTSRSGSPDKSKVLWSFPAASVGWEGEVPGSHDTRPPIQNAMVWNIRITSFCQKTVFICPLFLCVYQAGEREAAEGIPDTDWEYQRNILLASFQGRGYAARVRQLYQMEDVHPHHHPGAAGVGAASVAAGISLLEDSSDDPEEHRWRMEALGKAETGLTVKMIKAAIESAKGSYSY